MEGRSAELIADHGVRVRPAVAADAAFLGLIEVSAGERFRSVGMDDIADDEVPSTEEYLRVIEDGRIWVAELEGDVVGYVWVEDLGDHPHLEQISVVPEAGGRGVGLALIDAAVAWAAERGSTITLSTFRDVAWNAPWYARHGFVVLDEAELDDSLLALRDHEIELGLDVSIRVFMRRTVDQVG